MSCSLVLSFPTSVSVVTEANEGLFAFILQVSVSCGKDICYSSAYIQKNDNSLYQCIIYKKLLNSEVCHFFGHFLLENRSTMLME